MPLAYSLHYKPKSKLIKWLSACVQWCKPIIDSGDSVLHEVLMILCFYKNWLLNFFLSVALKGWILNDCYISTDDCSIIRLNARVISLVHHTEYLFDYCISVTFQLEYFNLALRLGSEQNAPSLSSAGSQTVKHVVWKTK